MKGQPKMTIREISERAGVSIATVSRVINGRGKYSEDTKGKVWRVIEDSNYYINVAAHNLRMNASKTIGLILPDLTNEFFAKITASIESKLFTLGYSNIICNPPDTGTYEQQYQALVELHNVCGIICIFGREAVVGNLALNVPVVFLGQPKFQESMDRRPCAWITADYRSRSFDATEELLKKGCRRIVYMQQQEQQDDRCYARYSQRHLGFLDALGKRDVPVEDCLFCRLRDSTVESAYQALSVLLKDHSEIDGILSNSALSAVGAIHALKAVGKQVPRDARVVSYDDTSMSKFFSPQITSISMDVDQYVSLAVSLIQKLIRGDTLEQKEYQVASRLIIREST